MNLRVVNNKWLSEKRLINNIDEDLQRVRKSEKGQYIVELNDQMVPWVDRKIRLDKKLEDTHYQTPKISSLNSKMQTQFYNQLHDSIIKK